MVITVLREADDYDEMIHGLEGFLIWEKWWVVVDEVMSDLKNRNGFSFDMKKIFLPATRRSTTFSFNNRSWGRRWWGRWWITS
jgi:hypothetical protein